MQGFVVLYEVNFIGYEFLGDFMQKIGETTARVMASDNYELQIEALKFWLDVAKTEAARAEKQEPVYYLPLYGPPLISILFEGLLSSQVSEDETEIDDDERNTVPVLCSNLLEIIVSILKDSCW